MSVFDVCGRIVIDLSVFGCTIIDLNVGGHVVIGVSCVWVCHEWF